MTQPTNEQLSIKYSFDFQFVDKPNLWLSTDVTILEAFESIKTGLLRNHPILKIQMFTINADDTSVSFVYDVVGAKQGNFPWSLQAI